VGVYTDPALRAPAHIERVVEEGLLIARGARLTVRTGCSLVRPVIAWITRD